MMELIDKRFTEERFLEDLQYIGQIARGYVSREIFEKWKGRIKFDDEDN